MRMVRNYGFFALATIVALFVSFSPTPADDGARLDDLERRIAALETALAALSESGAGAPEAVAELQRQIEILAAEIERLEMAGAETAAADDDVPRGLGPAASKVYARDRGVSIGGYGEVIYQNFDSRREDGSPSGATDQIDFLRAVLYAGYKFNDLVVFNSEIEFEHATTGAGTDDKGEVSLEFAYLDFLVRDALNVRAGLLLVPMGFINELHEPPTFLGAKRPMVETVLIPATWRENGAGIYGSAGSVEYRVYLVNGLAAVAGTSSSAGGYSTGGIRGGRTKGSRSAAEDFALTARVDWRPTEGLLLGASGFSGKAGQGQRTPGGQTIGARTTVLDAHVEYRRRGLQLRGLYARTSIDDATLVNAAQTAAGVLAPLASIGERQYGWYAEAGFDVLAHVEKTRHGLIPFVRHEQYDTQDRVPSGFSADPSKDVSVTTVGLSWLPIDQVAIKADYNRITNEARTGVDQFNVAVGYLF